ncbi:hypothetical protein [Teredinibacter turnerae]|uniref:hypothetical protein n=1 Tax=Teredinibacter turnerae TaxID=2426 RepID=UPI000406CE1A|nr:hypothetical protein [Teredinibacter turnerae]
MTGLLIPFGLDRDTKEIVEPEDAARGRACNCICPGCQAPLLSRHPKDNRIHFAHDSKHPEAKPEEECPFSSAVAIAMMARELVESLPGKLFEIRDYEYEYYFECCSDIESVWVTEQKCLTIASARKKPQCAGQTFDLELCFGEAKILVDLFYKGKPPQLVENADVFAEGKPGVLAISCDTFDMSALAENKGTRFSDAVMGFLLKTGFRRWSFHPRQLSLIDKLTESHQCQPSITAWEISGDFEDDSEFAFDDEYKEPAPKIDSQPLPEFEPKQYRCAMCKETWLQKEAGAPTCPKCNTHLFSIDV